jgi:hypothetical protein
MGSAADAYEQAVQAAQPRGAWADVAGLVVGLLLAVAWADW